eukprot:11198934-Lingulodinium_polyedra.AAC.1
MFSSARELGLFAMPRTVFVWRRPQRCRSLRKLPARRPTLDIGRRSGCPGWRAGSQPAFVRFATQFTHSA